MHMINKKGQSISINTIVVAAIALIVLVLMVLIFTGNITSWRTAVESCESKGGMCYADDRCGGESTREVAGAYKCTDVNQFCCIKTRAS